MGRDAMDWDPQQYLKFSGPRFRPGLDLMGRIPAFAPPVAVDLGCGNGALTAVLAQRWPTTAIVGIDNSADMLRRARNDHPQLVFQQADIADWTPERPIGLIFTNAVLHWLDEHAALLPRLMGFLANGGVLAVQMPRNFDQPTHRLLHETVEAGNWSKPIPLRTEAPVAPPEAYVDMLADHAASLDIWETTYLHLLEGTDPVLEWVKGTALLPVTNVLEGEELERFLDAYRTRLRAAYPPRTDGQTVLPFQRLFIVATAR